MNTQDSIVPSLICYNKLLLERIRIHTPYNILLLNLDVLRGSKICLPYPAAGGHTMLKSYQCIWKQYFDFLSADPPG